MFGGQQLLWTAEDAHDPTCHRGQAVSLREGARVQLVMATGRAMAPVLHTGDGWGGMGMKGRWRESHQKSPRT